MNTMMLSVDETKVKLSNLTRINSLKNTNYCENLIRDDHGELDTENESVTKKEPVSDLRCITSRLGILSPRNSIDFYCLFRSNCRPKLRLKMD